MGFGAAIVYKLYEPLASKNQERIATLMAVYKKVYIIIGISFLSLGILFMPFLNLFFDDVPDVSNFYLIYLFLIINAAIPYFFAFRLNILIADQKEYILSIYNIVFNTLINIFKIVSLLLTQSFVLYILVEVFFNVIRSVILSLKSQKMHSYLAKIKPNPLAPKEKKELLKDVRAMMQHKIGGVVVFGMDNILLLRFSGLTVVALYSNYLLVISGLSVFTNTFFRSITASVGNLVATKSKKELEFYFYIVNFIGFWLMSFCSIMLWLLFNPFIQTWLDDSYLLPLSIVALVVLNFYLLGMRQSVLMFRDTLGLFWYDRHKPIFEGGVNLIFSIILGMRFGAEGVFLGTALSTILVCLWVEPFILYKHGLHQKVRRYFKKYVLYFSLGIINLSLSHMILSFIQVQNFLDFILLGILATFLVNGIFIVFFHKTTEFKYVFNIFRLKIKTFRKIMN